MTKFFICSKKNIDINLNKVKHPTFFLAFAGWSEEVASLQNVKKNDFSETDKVAWANSKVGDSFFIKANVIK